MQHAAVGCFIPKGVLGSVWWLSSTWFQYGRRTCHAWSSNASFNVSCHASQVPRSTVTPWNRWPVTCCIIGFSRKSTSLPRMPGNSLSFFYLFVLKTSIYVLSVAVKNCCAQLKSPFYSAKSKNWDCNRPAITLPTHAIKNAALNFLINIDGPIVNAQQLLNYLGSYYFYFPLEGARILKYTYQWLETEDGSGFTGALIGARFGSFTAAPSALVLPYHQQRSKDEYRWCSEKRGLVVQW